MKKSWKKTVSGCNSGEGESQPYPFWEIKKMPWFWKKGPDFVHPEVKFIIQNIVLRVS